jgi:CRP/FNR family transcriptional regulator, cyclic AMP receptor protein
VLGQDAKVELLSKVPLFAECSKRDLRSIARLTSEVALPAGHTLIREGAGAFSFFVLLEGTAEVRRRSRRVATLGAGDFVGELALLLERPRSATVLLTTPARLLTVSAHNFRPLLKRSPGLPFKLIEGLAQRLAAMASEAA